MVKKTWRIKNSDKTYENLDNIRNVVFTLPDMQNTILIAYLTVLNFLNRLFHRLLL